MAHGQMKRAIPSSRRIFDFGAVACDESPKAHQVRLILFCICPLYSAAMRRWFTVLLLVMLPFQFAWTAAAAYCQHEDSPSARHIGHHEHQHKASSEGAKAESSAQDAIKAVKVFGDNDCGYCHLGAAKLVRMQTQVVATLTGPQALDTVVHPLRTRDPDRFERPKWRLA